MRHRSCVLLEGHAGESGLSHKQAQLWRAGDRCAVMFDPEKPASSVWAAHRNG